MSDMLVVFLVFAIFQRDVCKSPYLLNDMCPSQLFFEKWPWKHALSQQDSQQIGVPFSTASDFQKFESHLSFYLSFFQPTPEMDTYPGAEHLTPNVGNNTKTAYVPVSTVCTYTSPGFMHFLQICFFKLKMVESVLKVRRIELFREAEPTRSDTTSSDFPSVARRVSVIFYSR